MAIKLPIVGFTEAGTVSFKVQLFVPIFDDPLYVSHVILQVPDIAFGICDARDNGGFQDTDVEVVLLIIVPLVFPNEYVNVWVNDDDALLIDMVEVPFISAFVADTPEARGIVFNVCVPFALTETAYVYTPASQLKLKDFVPSEL